MVEPLGHIPGPYGKPIAVFASPDQPGEFFHDLNGVMDFAAVHGDAARKRCRRALDGAWKDGGSIPFQLILDNGGRKVPQVALPKASRSAYLDIPRTPRIDEVRENWVELAMDQPSWSARAAALLHVIGDSFDTARGWAIAGVCGAEEVQAFAVSILLTSALEHLAEQEIDCLEAAAFYSMTAHEEWAASGLEWLEPFRSSWFQDWASERPAWQLLAATMREVNTDLPAWIVKGGAL